MLALMARMEFGSTQSALGTSEHLVRPDPVWPPTLLTRTVLDHQIKIGTYPEEMIKLIPLERWGLAEEIAEGVVFLASEKASFITGEELYIDGGSVVKCHG